MDQEELQHQLAAATAKVSELEGELKKAKGEDLDRIQKLEAQLIEQDHRLPHIAWNLFKRGRPGSTDPLRHAARKAFVWFWFKPTTLAVAAAGIAAWITVYLLYQQNALVSRQTDAVIEQNQKFDAQLQYEREANYQARKAQLLAILYDSNQPLRVRQEAVQSFVALQSARGVKIDLTLVPLRDAKLPGVNLRGADLYDANLGYSDLGGADLSDVNLNAADLVWADLRGARLIHASLIGSELNDADMSGANLSFATLNWNNGHAESTLTGADLSGAVLYWTDFRIAQVERLTFEFACFDFIGALADRP